MYLFIHFMPTVCFADDVGYGMTDVVLNAMLALQSQHDAGSSPLCSWVMITQADNLYSRHLPEHMEPLMAAHELIGFDYVEHHSGRIRLQLCTHLHLVGPSYTRQ